MKNKAYILNLKTVDTPLIIDLTFDEAFQFFHMSYYLIKDNYVGFR